MIQFARIHKPFSVPYQHLIVTVSQSSQTLLFSDGGGKFNFTLHSTLTKALKQCNLFKSHNNKNARSLHKCGDFTTYTNTHTLWLGN